METRANITSPGEAPFSTTGRVASGLGRGAGFVSLDWMRQELRDKIQLTPFPGTLNLAVEPAAREALFARRDSFLRIANPAEPTCPGYLLRLSLSANGKICSSAYLILPELTMYKDVLEIIAPENLRQALHLKDGDSVRIEEFPANR